MSVSAGFNVMTNNIPPSETQLVNTPIHDPALAAVLVAMDFPLVRPRFAVKKIDLNSQHREQPADFDSWVFGASSPRHGHISAVLQRFSAPLPRVDSDVLDVLAYAKITMHNRHVLKLAAVQRLPLHQIALKKTTRLSSWSSRVTAPVEEDFTSVLPRATNTDFVALATAFGHRLASVARYGDQLTFLLRPNTEALYTVSEIEAKFRDRAYIRANADPLAVCSAACISFPHLFTAAEEGGDTFVIHKNGKYASLPANASTEEKIEVARHLST